MYSLRRFIKKLFMFPNYVQRIAIGKIILPNWLRLIGVKFGSNCRFVGWSTFIISPGAKIIIGNNVYISSVASQGARYHRTKISSVGDNSIIEIGDYSGLTAVSIACSTSVKIGKRVLLGNGVGIWDSDYHPLRPEKRRENQTKNAKSSGIVIEDEVFIGARSIILRGVTIGRGAVVGAASVVRKDVKPGEIVIGNPAKMVGHIKMLPD